MSATSEDARPSTSQNVSEPRNDDFELELNIKNEEAEIACLQLPDDHPSNSKEENVSAASLNSKRDDERVPTIQFHCSGCDMREMVHYFGRQPPFVCGLEFLEDTYVMRDPFQAPPPRWKPKAEYFIALGAHCSRCQRLVCKDAECSFYYTSTYCLNCAKEEIKSFPFEAQVKIKKQLAAK